MKKAFKRPLSEAEKHRMAQEMIKEMDKSKKKMEQSATFKLLLREKTRDWHGKYEDRMAKLEAEKKSLEGTIKRFQENNPIMIGLAREAERRKTINELKEKSDVLGFWVHKFFRMCDSKGCYDVWKAIDNISDEVWKEAVESGLTELINEVMK